MGALAQKMPMFTSGRRQATLGTLSQVMSSARRVWERTVRTAQQAEAL